jgi:hypothetical protein
MKTKTSGAFVVTNLALDAVKLTLVSIDMARDLRDDTS